MASILVKHHNIWHEVGDGEYARQASQYVWQEISDDEYTRQAPQYVWLL